MYLLTFRHLFDCQYTSLSLSLSPLSHLASLGRSTRASDRVGGECGTSHVFFLTTAAAHRLRSTERTLKPLPFKLGVGQGW